MELFFGITILVMILKKDVTDLDNMFEKVRHNQAPRFNMRTGFWKWIFALYGIFIVVWIIKWNI